jgi:hypothetical protein
MKYWPDSVFLNASNDWLVLDMRNTCPIPGRPQQKSEIFFGTPVDRSPEAGKMGA